MAQDFYNAFGHDAIGRLATIQPLTRGSAGCVGVSYPGPGIENQRMAGNENENAVIRQSFCLWKKNLNERMLHSLRVHHDVNRLKPFFFCGKGFIDQPLLKRWSLLSAYVDFHFQISLEHYCELLIFFGFYRSNGINVYDGLSVGSVKTSGLISVSNSSSVSKSGHIFLLQRYKDKGCSLC